MVEKKSRPCCFDSLSFASCGVNSFERPRDGRRARLQTVCKAPKVRASQCVVLLSLKRGAWCTCVRDASWRNALTRPPSLFFSFCFDCMHRPPRGCTAIAAVPAARLKNRRAAPVPARRGSTEPQQRGSSAKALVIYVEQLTHARAFFGVLACQGKGNLTGESSPLSRAHRTKAVFLFLLL
jgi:hypothetical protein